MSSASTSTSKPDWPLLGKMMAQFPKLSKFNYHYDKMFGITTDHKLLFIEDKSPKITEYINFRGKVIKDIVCGMDHFIVVSGDGELHSWGGNKWGQLGLGHTEPQSKPTRVNIENIDKVNISGYYSMALTFDGECYQWGRVAFSKLSGVPTPTKLELPSGVKFKQIVCSQLFSLALGTDNRAYGWRNFLDFPLNGLSVNIAQPTKFPLEENIKSVACNLYNCVFLTFEGKLYETSKDTSDPIVPIDTSAVFEKVLSFPSRIFLAMQTDGKVFVWGLTKEGKLQTPTETNLPLAQSMTKHYGQWATSMMMDIDDIQPRRLTIAEQIGKLFDSNEKSDIEFIFPAEGKSIKAHILVLTINSDYMRAQLSDCWFPSGKMNIELYSYTQYYNYIRFLYTQHIRTDTLEEAFDLLKLAKCFLEKSLETDCCEHIVDEYLNLDTCVTIYEFFVNNSLIGPHERVATFMAEHSSELYTLPQFRNMNAKIFKDLILQQFQIIPK